MEKTENPYIATIRVPFQISPLIAHFCVMIHFISIISPWFSSLDWSVKLILSGLVLLSLAYYCNQFYVTKNKKRVTELILGCEDDWQIKMSDGTVYFGRLQSSFVHPLLVIIKLHYAGYHRHFILTPEFIDADQFRRLRVRLRFPVRSRD